MLTFRFRCAALVALLVLPNALVSADAWLKDTLSTRDEQGHWQLVAWGITGGRCRPNLADCKGAMPDTVFVSYNPGDATGVEHPLRLMSSNKADATEVEFKAGSCKLVIFMDKAFSSAAYEITAISKDLWGDGITDEKLPTNADNVSFDLYSTKNTYRDTATDQDRSINPPITAMIQTNPESDGFCTGACANSQIPGYCYRCCGDCTANDACSGCDACKASKKREIAF